MLTLNSCSETTFVTSSSGDVFLHSSDHKNLTENDQTTYRFNQNGRSHDKVGKRKQAQSTLKPRPKTDENFEHHDNVSLWLAIGLYTQQA